MNKLIGLSIIIVAPVFILPFYIIYHTNDAVKNNKKNM